MAGKSRPIISNTGGFASGGQTPRTLDAAIDRVLAVHRPLVLAQLRGIRRSKPDATPAEIVRTLERRYLATVTTGGAAVGATGVVPGIGTAVTLALSGVETAAFLEATAIFAQSLSELHGISIEDPVRARALVLTMMLGREGSTLVRQLAGQATGGTGRSGYWGELITGALPMTIVGPLADRLKSMFLRRFAAAAGTGFIGRAIPFGIGAVVGGAGNNILGRKVVENSRLAFGPAPEALPTEIESAARTLRVRAPHDVPGSWRGTGSRVTKAIQAVGTATWDAATDASKSVTSASTTAGRSVSRSVTTAGKSVVHVSTSAGQRAMGTSTQARDAMERATQAATKRANEASASAKDIIERMRIERERPDGWAPGEVDLDDDGNSASGDDKNGTDASASN